jgi:hypothetical protein
MLEVQRKSELTNGFRDSHPAKILTAALTYLGVVFGIAFVFGVVRVLWIVPILGLRNAEIAEQPAMLVVIFLAARWIVRRLGDQFTRVEILSVGVIAFALLIFVEVMVALFIQPKRPSDTLSGVVYFAMLGVFALMPWLLTRIGRAPECSPPAKVGNDDSSRRR